MSTQGCAPKIPSGMHVGLTTTFSKIAVHTKQHRIHIPMQTGPIFLHCKIRYITLVLAQEIDSCSITNPYSLLWCRFAI